MGCCNFCSRILNFLLRPIIWWISSEGNWSHDLPRQRNSSVSICLKNHAIGLNPTICIFFHFWDWISALWDQQSSFPPFTCIFLSPLSLFLETEASNLGHSRTKASLLFSRGSTCTGPRYPVVYAFSCGVLPCFDVTVLPLLGSSRVTAVPTPAAPYVQGSPPDSK